MQSRSNFALSTRCRLAHADTRDYGRDRQASVVAAKRLHAQRVARRGEAGDRGAADCLELNLDRAADENG